MKNAFVRVISRILIVCMVGVPFQAQAGLIGTGEAVANAQASQAARAALASQLEALGIAADAARDRVAAFSDAEVVQLAGRIDSLAAGAFGGVGLGMVLVAIFLFWRFVLSDQAKAEAATAKPKPAPAPEKK